MNVEKYLCENIKEYKCAKNYIEKYVRFLIF